MFEDVFKEIPRHLREQRQQRSFSRDGCADASPTSLSAAKRVGRERRPVGARGPLGGGEGVGGCADHGTGGLSREPRNGVGRGKGADPPPPGLPGDISRSPYLPLREGSTRWRDLSIVEAIRDAMDLQDGRGCARRRVRRGRRLFRRRIPLHRRPAAQVWQVALLRRPAQRIRDRRASRSAWAPMGFGRSRNSSSPTTSIPAMTSSCRRRRGFATGWAATSLPPSLSACRAGRHLRR